MQGKKPLCALISKSEERQEGQSESSVSVNVTDFWTLKYG